jgi:penicillin amidase
MTRNARTEVDRARDIQRFGLETVERNLPPDPFIKIEPPKDLDLALITSSILEDYQAAIALPRLVVSEAGGEQGSNNWVVDGTMTASGKPMLANDPHRPVTLPSLRKTWHLVAPGIHIFGAGEPSLPGVALGHNDRIAWGFTIVGIDQQDIFVEKLNPENPNQYLYRGEWRNVEIEHEEVPVKGRRQPAQIELRHTLHGPVIHEDRARHVAYALKWVGSEPGGAGYLGALSLMRARNWDEFLQGVARYKVPSENLVYADVDGNIGWVAAGYAPVRTNWSGLLPVPGHTGEYEWKGFVPPEELPREFNPSRHYIATANHNILPEKYPHQLSFEWALPYRFRRIDRELQSRDNWDRIHFERLQQDVVSLPARRFQAILRRWEVAEGSRAAAIVPQLLAWDAQLRVDSERALIYKVWFEKLAAALFGADLGSRVNVETVLRRLETEPQPRALGASLDQALDQIQALFPDRNWKWGRLHQIVFRHPLGKEEWNRGSIPRPGDAYTVNATSGPRLRQTNGASYRQIIDLSDWDRSVMTNVPGEVGDPTSEHYDDLIGDWNHGQYHPMPFSRRAVEAAVSERYMIRRR